MFTRSLLIPFLAIALTACAGTQPIKFPETQVVTSAVYAQKLHADGIVLMDINWGRRWNCGGFQNAQLISLAFDRLPMRALNNEAEPSLVMLNPARATATPAFLNYAYSLEPGEYALSAFSIKTARSISDVYFQTAQRAHLYKDGKPIGGTFSVKSGEVVFIGNFYLDCTYAPTLWRYYPKEKSHFDQQLSEYKQSFPFLNLSAAQYRLFKTEHFGLEYQLPAE